VAAQNGAAAIFLPAASLFAVNLDLAWAVPFSRGRRWFFADRVLFSIGASKE